MEGQGVRLPEGTQDRGGKRRLDVEDAFYQPGDRHHSPRGGRHRHRITFATHI